MELRKVLSLQNVLLFQRLANRLSLIVCHEHQKSSMPEVGVTIPPLEISATSITLLFLSASLANLLSSPPDPQRAQTVPIRTVTALRTRSSAISVADHIKVVDSQPALIALSRWFVLHKSMLGRLSVLQLCLLCLEEAETWLGHDETGVAGGDHLDAELSFLLRLDLLELLFVEARKLFPATELKTLSEPNEVWQ